MQNNLIHYIKSRNQSKIFIKDFLNNQENLTQIKQRSKSSQRLFSLKPENITIKVKVINDKDNKSEEFLVSNTNKTGLSPIRKASILSPNNEKSKTPKPSIKLPILRKPCGIKNTSELLEIKSFRNYSKLDKKPAMCNVATNTSDDDEPHIENFKIDLESKIKAKGKKILILDAFPVSHKKRIVDIRKDLRIKKIRTKSSLK